MKVSEIVWREGGWLALVQLDALDRRSLDGLPLQSEAYPETRLAAAGSVAAAAL